MAPFKVLLTCILCVWNYFHSCASLSKNSGDKFLHPNYYHHNSPNNRGHFKIEVGGEKKYRHEWPQFDYIYQDLGNSSFLHYAGNMSAKEIPSIDSLEQYIHKRRTRNGKLFEKQTHVIGFRTKEIEALFQRHLKSLFMTNDMNSSVRWILSFPLGKEVITPVDTEIEPRKSSYTFESSIGMFNPNDKQPNNTIRNLEKNNGTTNTHRKNQSKKYRTRRNVTNGGSTSGPSSLDLSQRSLMDNQTTTKSVTPEGSTSSTKSRAFNLCESEYDTNSTEASLDNPTREYVPAKPHFDVNSGVFSNLEFSNTPKPSSLNDSTKNNDSQHFLGLEPDSSKINQHTNENLPPNQGSSGSMAIPLNMAVNKSEGNTFVEPVPLNGPISIIVPEGEDIDIGENANADAEPTPESEPETKYVEKDNGTEVSVGTKLNTKPHSEPTSEGDPETTYDEKDNETNAIVGTKLKVQPNSEPISESEPETKSVEKNNERNTTVGTKLKVKPHSDPTSESEPETKSVGKENETNATVGTKLNMKPNSEPISESKPETKSVEKDNIVNNETDVSVETKLKVKPHSEPEPESETEPEVEPEVYNKNDEMPMAEPGPDWVKAKKKWTYAWEIHIYGFGGMFGILALYTMMSLFRLYRIQRLLSRKYFLSLNVLMLAMCITRTFYLLFDPYNSQETLNISLDYFLYSISFPCMTSAFSILLYALLQATNMRIVSPAVQKIQILMCIVVVHFVLSITTDVLIGSYAGLELMLFVCQMYFIIWGLFLFFGYAYIFRKLYSHAMKRQKTVIVNTNSNGSVTKSKARNKSTLGTAVKVTFFTSICGLTTVGLEIYAIVGVYNTFTKGQPEPWPWWLYHTVLRLIEVLMAGTMIYVASQPFRYRKGETKTSCGAVCAPCIEILCCGYTLNNTTNNTSDFTKGWTETDANSTKIQSFYEENGTTNNLQNDDIPQNPFFTTRENTVSLVDIPFSNSRQSSLLLFENSYDGLHTENDTSRIFDTSFNSPWRYDGFYNSVSTFQVQRGVVNSECTDTGNNLENEKTSAAGLHNGFQEKHTVCYYNNHSVSEEDGLRDISQTSNMTNAEFLQVPNSVRVAYSTENELEKAFESSSTRGENFENIEEGIKNQNLPSIDICEASKLPHLQETNLISVESPDLFEREKEDVESCTNITTTQQTIQMKTALQTEPDRPTITRAKSLEANIGDSKDRESLDKVYVNNSTQKLHRSFSCKESRCTRNQTTTTVKYSHRYDKEVSKA